MFSSVAVIGTGLIGGSIGLGLRAARPDAALAGHDIDPHARSLALERGAFDRVEADVAAAVTGADLVVVAVPVDACEPVCREVAGAAPGAVVTDVGSAKAGVVGACEPVLGERFVGGHPMAGSERHGMEAAAPDLFEDASWILTPTERTSSTAYRTVAGLAGALGARPVALDPGDHDRLLARLSHLPQLVSSALVAAAVAAEDKESLLGLAAGGFRDVTRIAASDPGLWVTILRANRKAVLEALEEYRSGLARLGALLEEERWEDLGAFLGNARRARIDAFTKPEMHEVPVTLTMPVLDRPGVLAEVTTAAGSLGANIEDLRIVHSSEGRRGVLEIVVGGVDPATRLAARLTELGYSVHEGRPE